MTKQEIKNLKMGDQIEIGSFKSFVVDVEIICDGEAAWVKLSGFNGSHLVKKHLGKLL